MSVSAAAPRRVVFFGDSRADWWAVPVRPGLQCVNAGVPGASAGYLARRFQGMVAPLRPDIVVVQMGVNDLCELTPRSSGRDAAVAVTREAILAVAAAAGALGARVIVTTIFPLARGPWPDTAVQQAIAEVNRGLIDRLAAAQGAPGQPAAAAQVLDSAAVLVGADGYVRAAYADDELHLSHAGYAALNEALAPLLEV